MDVSIILAIVIVAVFLLIILWLNYAKEKRCKIREKAQRLWTEQVLWTKSYITDVVENVGSSAETVNLGKLTETNYKIAEMYPECDKNRVLMNLQNVGSFFAMMMREVLNNNNEKAKGAWKFTIIAARDTASSLAVGNVCSKILAKMMEQYMRAIGAIFSTRVARSWGENSIAVDNAMSIASDIANYTSSGIKYV